MTEYVKICREDGLNYVNKTINYRAAIGSTVYPADPQTEPYYICNKGLLHAFNNLEYGVYYMLKMIAAWSDLKYAGLSAYVVQGTPVAEERGNGDNAKYGFLELYVVEEIEL